MSEYTVAPAGNLAIRPPNISATQASGISLAGMTAYQALFQSAQLEEGQSLFVNGGSTTVGSYAIQFAKAIGVKVVASASEKNKDFVLGLGADDVCQHSKLPIFTLTLLSSLITRNKTLLLSSLKTRHLRSSMSS